MPKCEYQYILDDDFIINVISAHQRHGKLWEMKCVATAAADDDNVDIMIIIIMVAKNE